MSPNIGVTVKLLSFLESETHYCSSAFFSPALILPYLYRGAEVHADGVRDLASAWSGGQDKVRVRGAPGGGGGGGCTYREWERERERRSESESERWRLSLGILSVSHTRNAVR